jgi:2-methylcitrate dehydratase PrpD
LGDSQQKALFNLPYAVANVLTRKSARMEHYTDEFIRDPGIIGLSKKVKVEATVMPEMSKAIDLKVRLKNGKELKAHFDQPRGFEDTPLTREEIKDKFRANVTFSKTVSKSKSEKALTMMENLEEVNDVSKLLTLLVA